MESFVIAGKAKTVFRLIALKAKLEQARLNLEQAIKATLRKEGNNQ